MLVRDAQSWGVVKTTSRSSRQNEMNGIPIKNVSTATLVSSVIGYHSFLFHVGWYKVAIALPLKWYLIIRSGCSMCMQEYFGYTITYRHFTFKCLQTSPKHLSNLFLSLGVFKIQRQGFKTLTAYDMKEPLNAMYCYDLLLSSMSRL